MKDESTSFALLGLLSIAPMSGYEMHTHLKDSMSYFWSESFGQIYPTLKRLAADGLIKSIASSTSGRREKQVYRLSAKGRTALKDWLAHPVQRRQARDEFLLKLFFGGVVPGETIVEHIRVHRAEQQRILSMYEVIRDHVHRERQDYRDRRYWLLILERGIALRQTEIGWCDRALRALSEREGGKLVRLAGGTRTGDNT